MMHRCRFCDSKLFSTFVDLNSSPLANSLLTSEAMLKGEVQYPLHARVCEKCFLVQLEPVVDAGDIFCNYSYFSSYSTSWLEHARLYCASMVDRFNLNINSQVVEVASNDGYLLKNFSSLAIPVLGIEPAINVANVAMANGVNTKNIFFGAQSARHLLEEGFAADLICANNVLAHVPDINDFVEGFQILLKPNGVATFEFPHLLNLIEYSQFDTIYHEHYSYLSLISVEAIFDAHDLMVFDVEEISTHGGSLRIYATKKGNRDQNKSVEVLRMKEINAGLGVVSTYTDFSKKVVQLKSEILDFFLKVQREGKKIAGYGAPAKGNTLLNYCGIGPEFLSFTVDASPHKQGNFLPGSRIPILSLEALSQYKPDYVFILPWNLKDEISNQLDELHVSGTKFVTAVPHIKVW